MRTHVAGLIVEVFSVTHEQASAMADELLSHIEAHSGCAEKADLVRLVERTFGHSYDWRDSERCRRFETRNAEGSERARDMDKVLHPKT